MFLNILEPCKKNRAKENGKNSYHVRKKKENRKLKYLEKDTQIDNTKEQYFRIHVP